MIVDTSAIVAVIRNEPEAEVFKAAFADCLHAGRRSRLSSAGYLETAMVVDGRNDPVLGRGLDRFLDTLGVEIVPLTPEHARIARAAHRDFGRGSGHPAKLNFGDCISYALAVETGEPLLFKGDDFVHTDVTPAVVAR